VTNKELARLNRRWNCRLTTVGRKSGQLRTVTIWFVLEPGTVYLTGGKDVPQWCRNIRKNGDVTVQIGGVRLRGTARVAEGREAQAVIDQFPRKYWLARVARLFGGYTASVPIVVTLAD